MKRDLFKKVLRELNPSIYKKLRELYGNQWGLLKSFGEIPVRLLPDFVISDYESIFSQWTVNTIEPGWTVFDVGAYAGFFSVIFAKKVGRNGLVVSFEPTVELLEPFMKHIKLNGVDEHVKHFVMAVSDASGSADFFSMGRNTANSLNYDASAVNRRFSPTGEINRISVECTTLDLFVEKTGYIPQFIKIDVEGAELSVLRGGIQILKRYRPIIGCEVHEYQLGKFGHKVDDLFSFMRDLNYSVQILEEYGKGITHVGFLPGNPEPSVVSTEDK